MPELSKQPANWNRPEAQEWQEQLRQGRLLQDIPELAAVHFQLALELAPHEPEVKLALAQALIRNQQALEALVHLQELLATGDSSPDLRFWLALAQEQLGQLESAQQQLNTLLRQQALHAPARLLLARIEARLGLREFAIAGYKRYLQLQPSDLVAMEELADLLEQNQQPLEAADILLGIYHQDPERVQVLLRWLQLKAVGDPILMMQLLIQLAREVPNLRSRIAVQMASVMEHASDTEERQRCLEMALEDPLLPDRPAWQLRLALNIPYLPQAAHEITAAVHHLDARLREFEKHLPEGAQVQADYSNLYPYLRSWTPLNFLPYLNIDPLPWRRRWSQLFEKILPPQRPLLPKVAGAQPRIGFLLNQNTAVKAFLAELLRHWPAEHGQVCLFINAPHQEAIPGQVLRADFEQQYLPQDPDAAIDMLLAARLDLLFLSEVHTDQLQQSLLALRRLAPVQVTSWLSSGTTGSDYIDYFLSSELLEQSDQPEKFYSEELIRLKEIPAYMIPPVMLGPIPPRSDYGLPEGRLYICPHLIYKLHPDYDAILAEILESDPEAQLVLLSNPDNRFLRNRLLARLENTYAELMPRIWFLPKLSHQDYLGLLNIADVMLDPFYFGGGTSSYEALHFGVPVITWPGERLHGRITYAYYRKMDVLDCVAYSAKDYVHLAVEIASQPDLNREIRAKLKAKSHLLFENNEAVNEVADTLLKLASQPKV